MKINMIPHLRNNKNLQLFEIHIHDLVYNFRIQFMQASVHCTDAVSL